MQEVVIYSPSDGKKNQRWKRLMGRVVKLLRHEYEARGRPLPLERLWALAHAERGAVCCYSSPDHPVPLTHTICGIPFSRLRPRTKWTRGFTHWSTCACSWKKSALPGELEHGFRILPLVLVGATTNPVMAEERGISGM